MSDLAMISAIGLIAAVVVAAEELHYARSWRRAHREARACHFCGAPGIWGRGLGYPACAKCGPGIPGAR